MGNAYAQGKLILWKKEILDQVGGFSVLSGDLAEDVSAYKAVRDMGLKVRLLDRPVWQPVGERTLKTVRMRQVRWARVRRLGLPWIYVLELINGSHIQLLLCWLAFGSWPIFGVYFISWYVTEWWVAHSAGWSRGVKDVPLWLLRDLLMPALWVAGIWSSGYDWRGSVTKKEGGSFRLEYPNRR